MEPNAGQPRKSRRIYIVLAWASPLSAAVSILVLWQMGEHHHGQRGERSTAVLILYGLLMVFCVVGCLAGLFSLFGIRSWRNALTIVPAALAGICLNGGTAVMCLYAYALEGRNIGG